MASKKKKAPAIKKKAQVKKPVKKIAKKKTAKASKKSATQSAKKSAAKTTQEKTATKPTNSSKEQFQPLKDGVLIEPEGRAEKTAGGIYIPQTVSERPHQGRVLAIGSGSRTKKGQIRPLDVKVGDQILYGSFAGTQLVVGGRELLLLREDDILGVVKP